MAKIHGVIKILKIECLEPDIDYSIDLDNATGFLSIHNGNHAFELINFRIRRWEKNKSCELNINDTGLSCCFQNLELSKFDIKEEIKVIKKFYSKKNCACDNDLDFSRSYNESSDYQFTFSKHDLIDFLEKYAINKVFCINKTFENFIFKGRY